MFTYDALPHFTPHLLTGLGQLIDIIYAIAIG